MLDHDEPQATRKSEDTTLLAKERAKILALITARGREDRYADLLSRYRTPAGRDLIRQLFGEIAGWRRKSGKRKFGAKSGQTFHVAVERFVGDLLRARAGENSSGRIYHSIGKTSFREDPVNYDVFHGVLGGLKALGFIGHRRGQTRS